MCVLNSLMSSEHLWGDVKFFQSGCKKWFCPILTRTGYCGLFNFSQYSGVKWYPIVVLICIYWWVMMLSAFSCAHQVIWMLAFQKCLPESFAHFFFFLICLCYFLLTCRSSNAVWVSALSDRYVFQISDSKYLRNVFHFSWYLIVNRSSWF